MRNYENTIFFLWRNSMRRRRNSFVGSNITYTKNEPYAVCFYLYNVFKTKSNKILIREYDESINAFLDYTETLDRTERLSKILEYEVKVLEKQNILIPLVEPASKEMMFDDCDIPYIYEQDKKVDREMRSYDFLLYSQQYNA